MHFFSPERPLVAARPGFDPGPGYAIPQVCLTPLPGGQVQVGVMLPIDTNLFQWHEVQLTPNAIANLLEELVANPEACFGKWFGWVWRESQTLGQTPSQTPELSFGDFGL